MNQNKIVAVALSGGVDSATTAYLLKEQGYQVFGVTMRLFQDTEVEDARRVAKKLDIPHYVMDYTKEFEAEIIEKFIDIYLQGLTPNPCLMCNLAFKYGRLLEDVKKLGAQYLALGHYATIVYDEQNRAYHVKKAKAQRKDQSYLLYQLTQQELKSILLPLNSFENKEQVREILKDVILDMSKKQDSRNICFTKGQNFCEYIIEKRKLTDITGNFVTKDGRILGRHKGVFYYTIGQKRGIGLSPDNRYYVWKINASTNEVILTEEENDLYYKEIQLDSVTYTVDSYGTQTQIRAVVKLCQWGYEIPCTIYNLSKNHAKVVFDQPERAPAPGQSAVFYMDDEVIGGGRIL